MSGGAIPHRPLAFCAIPNRFARSFATQTVWPVGPLLVQACGIAPGQRVLDVAAGTGNTAIRAARSAATRAHQVALGSIPTGILLVIARKRVR